MEEAPKRTETMSERMDRLERCEKKLESILTAHADFHKKFADEYKRSTDDINQNIDGITEVLNSHAEQHAKESKHDEGGCQCSGLTAKVNELSKDSVSIWEVIDSLNDRLYKLECWKLDTFKESEESNKQLVQTTISSETYSLKEAVDIINRNTIKKISVHDIMPIFVKSGYAYPRIWEKSSVVEYCSSRNGEKMGLFEQVRDNGSHNARLTNLGLIVAEMFAKTIED